MMDSIEDLMIKAEKESFKEAAKTAKKYNTQLVFMEDGKIIKRHPTKKDLTGEDIDYIKID